MRKKLVTRLAAEFVAAAARSCGERIAFTNGCFDGGIHLGHLTCLQEAREQGDILIVGLNSDESVRSHKGLSRPLRAQEERAAVLAALECVDYVVIFNEPTPLGLIECIRPDCLIKGGDYSGREETMSGSEFVRSYGGRVHITRLVPGVSTTRILEQ